MTMAYGNGIGMYYTGQWMVTKDFIHFINITALPVVQPPDAPFPLPIRTYVL